MAILFNIKVFEGALTGTTDVQYSPAELNAQLGQAEKYFCFVKIAQGAGSPSTFTVTLETSCDNVNWTTKATLFNATSFSTSGTTFWYATDLGTTTVGGGFARVKIQLGGSNVSAGMQVWLTGRSND